MIPSVTENPGAVPDLNDPNTFDARMTAFAAWFAQFPVEANAMVAAMNAALNDDGSVLETAGEAIALAANMNVPVTTAGTSTAFTLDMVYPPVAYKAGLVGVIKMHLESGISPTINIGNLGAIPIQIRNQDDVLEAVSPGLLGPNETFVFVISAGFVCEILSQPVRELVAGPMLLPLATQTGDFDDLVENSHKQVIGDWSNGPLGSESTDYDAVNAFCEVRARGDFIFQSIWIDRGTWIEEYTRQRRSGVWSTWLSKSGLMQTLAATSGGPKIFTFPIEAFRHTLSYNNTSFAGTNHLFVRLGFDGTVYDSGYFGSTGTSGAEVPSAGGFIVFASNSNVNGHMHITKNETNDFTSSHSVAIGADANGGSTLFDPGPVNQIVVQAAGSNDFDLGQLSLHSEFR